MLTSTISKSLKRLAPKVWRMAIFLRSRMLLFNLQSLLFTVKALKEQWNWPLKRVKRRSHILKGMDCVWQSKNVERFERSLYLKNNTKFSCNNCLIYWIEYRYDLSSKNFYIHHECFTKMVRYIWQIAFSTILLKLPIH